MHEEKKLAQGGLACKESDRSAGVFGYPLNELILESHRDPFQGGGVEVALRLYPPRSFLRTLVYDVVVRCARRSTAGDGFVRNEDDRMRAHRREGVDDIATDIRLSGVENPLVAGNLVAYAS